MAAPERHMSAATAAPAQSVLTVVLNVLSVRIPVVPAAVWHVTAVLMADAMQVPALNAAASGMIAAGSNGSAAEELVAVRLSAASRQAKSVLAKSVLAPSVLAPSVLAKSVWVPFVLAPSAAAPCAMASSVLASSVLVPFVPSVLALSVLAPSALKNSGVLLLAQHELAIADGSAAYGYAAAAQSTSFEARVLELDRLLLLEIGWYCKGEPRTWHMGH